MDWKGLVGAAVLAMMLLAGCTGVPEDSVTVTKQVATSTATQESRDLGCDAGEGRLHSGSQVGQGRLTIKVTDGSGAVIASNTYNAPSQSGDDQKLTGTPGQWTLRLDMVPTEMDYGGYSGSQGGNQRYFSGQLAVTLTC